MALNLFNTLSRSVQTFAPLDPHGLKVGMYCCGPTVYDYAHIGNWRTFVFADLVRRLLEFNGYQVTHVMNITDVEDKIIKRVREQATTLRLFTSQYETAFLEDLRALGCREPHQKPRATEHIPQIIALIEKLLARGIAYQAPDGSVYFSIDKYRGCGCQYGQLLKLNFDEMRAGERVKSDEYAKESIADFALWKTRVPEDGAVYWRSPFGEGRPGWHIECSAMSTSILGDTFDLHLGGEDLVFPHHEDEIAQSEGATGKPFVKFWLHGAHLLVEGKKMSKSLGNYFTLRDLQAKGYTGREVRYLLLSAHYRETFNFTLEGLAGAKTALARIDECVAKLRELAGSGKALGAEPTTIQSLREEATSALTPALSPGRGGIVGSPTERVALNPDPGSEDDSLVAAFQAALNEDLNISAAWGTVFEWVRKTNRALAENTLTVPGAAAALAGWEKINTVLGIGLAAEAEAPAELQALLVERQNARKNKDFKRSDEIRDQLKALGWVIEDSPKGQRLKKL